MVINNDCHLYLVDAEDADGNGTALEPCHFPDSEGSLLRKINCHLYLVDAEDADGEDADGVEDHQLLAAPCSLKHCKATV
jgi:hypothetical protein